MPCGPDVSAGAAAPNHALDQVIPAAEPRPVSGQQQYVHGGIEIRALDAEGQLTDQARGYPVAAVGTVKRESRDPIDHLVAHGRRLAHDVMSGVLHRAGAWPASVAASPCLHTLMGAGASLSALVL